MKTHRMPSPRIRPRAISIVCAGSTRSGAREDFGLRDLLAADPNRPAELLLQHALDLTQDLERHDAADPAAVGAVLAAALGVPASKRCGTTFHVVS